MDCPAPTSSASANSLDTPYWTPSSSTPPTSPVVIECWDLSILFSILETLAAAQQTLARFQGWLDFYADNPDPIDSRQAHLSDDQLARFQRLANKLTDNIALIGKRLQDYAVDSGRVPTGVVPKALRCAANHADAEIASVWQMLAEIKAAPAAQCGPSDVETTYRNCKGRLEQVLEVLIQACRNVDLYVYVMIHFSLPNPSTPTDIRVFIPV